MTRRPYLVLAHVAFITVGYASMDKVVVPTEVSRLVLDYPGMVAATIGTLVMIGTVVTSLVVVRRHFRYEAWYAVHLLVYLGIALAWFHQIPTGNELTADPTAATYWTATPMMRTVDRNLRRSNVPRAHIHTERFAL